MTSNQESFNSTYNQNLYNMWNNRVKDILDDKDIFSSSRMPIKYFADSYTKQDQLVYCESMMQNIILNDLGFEIRSFKIPDNYYNYAVILSLKFKERYIVKYFIINDEDVFNRLIKLHKSYSFLKSKSLYIKWFFKN